MAKLIAGARRLTPPAPLADIHELGRFDCGSEALNSWLVDRARQSEGQTARTYVVCEGTVVVGYYCVSAGSVERRALPSKMRRTQGLPNFVPVTIIGRLARDLRYRGTGLGSDLLRDALLRVLTASRIVGSRAVLVHALDESAKRFWASNEFMEFPAGSGVYFLPLETVASAL